jgi:hypothetical protein
MINGCIIMMAIVLIFIISLADSSQLGISKSFLGLIAAFGASFTFGGTGNTMKLKCLRTINVDTSVFQFYTGMGSFLVSLPMIFYLGIFYCFQFVYLSVIGAFLITVIVYEAYYIVQSIGICKGSPIWTSKLLSL